MGKTITAKWSSQRESDRFRFESTEPSRAGWTCIAAALGRFYPFLKDQNTLRPDYAEQLLEQWEFDTRLKPVRGFPAYYGWIGAITDAHARVHRGLDLRCPVLSMHSDEADIVLDWRDIARWSRSLGKEVLVLAFPGGVHDLVLSRPEVREEVFRQRFAWAARALSCSWTRG